jgi:hypothetical protein
VLTRFAGQAESLWDDALPVEVRELPEDLAALDRLLADPELLEPIVARFRREVSEAGRAVLTDGRPTVAMETYVRRRAVTGLGGLQARPVGWRAKRRVRDRSRAIGPAVARDRPAHREAKAEVLKLTRETGRLLERSVREARRLAAVARRRARGRGARAQLKAAAQPEGLADRCERVAGQITRRVAEEPIKDRIVSLFDPDARPIRKGKLGKPNEFGYVTQLCEVTENTGRGAGARSCPARPRSGTRRRTRCCPARSPNFAGSRFARGRSRSTAASCPARPTRRWTSSPRIGCSSLAARNPAPNARIAECGATEPVRRAGSATSNAATRWTAAGSRARKATGSGLSGRSSPTTPTPSPSEPDVTVPAMPACPKTVVKCDTQFPDWAGGAAFAAGAVKPPAQPAISSATATRDLRMTVLRPAGPWCGYATMRRRWLQTRSGLPCPTQESQIGPNAGMPSRSMSWTRRNVVGLLLTTNTASASKSR